MDIKSQPIEIQEKWLIQRGWHQKSQGSWTDPDTRVSYATRMAVDRAISDCRIPSDMELKPEVPPRKDDAPFPFPKK